MANILWSLNVATTLPKMFVKKAWSVFEEETALPIRAGAGFVWKGSDLFFFFKKRLYKIKQRLWPNRESWNISQHINKKKKWNTQKYSKDIRVRWRDFMAFTKILLLDYNYYYYCVFVFFFVIYNCQWLLLLLAWPLLLALLLVVGGVPFFSALSRSSLSSASFIFTYLSDRAPTFFTTALKSFEYLRISFSGFRFGNGSDSSSGSNFKNLTTK